MFLPPKLLGESFCFLIKRKARKGKSLVLLFLFSSSSSVREHKNLSDVTILELETKIAKNGKAER